LLKNRADITAYDPKAMGTACQLLGDKIAYADDMYAAVKDADALVILTEWKEFAKADLNGVAQLMKTKKIMDFRNMLNPAEAQKLGFEYQCIGRKFD